MVHDSVDPRKILLLKKLSNIPRNINQLRENHNLIEFVLHELCHEDCLNLKKAAYLVDNKDFDCLHGVVGIDKTEPFIHTNIWQAPDDFSAYMKTATFNTKVRQLKHKSHANLSEKEIDLLEELSHELGMNRLKHFTVPLKYDNQGILLYESVNDDAIEENDLLSGLSFLSICPLF